MGEKLNDVLLATAKGGVSLLPGGGLLAEYIGLAQSSIANKRMNEWKEKVEQTLEKIPKSMNEIAQSEEFYSCVQTATIGAMRAYQEEKRILFANALYHSAIDLDLDTDKKIFFFNLLGDYTLSHIKLLQYFSKDNSQINNRVQIIGGTEYPTTGIMEALPEFKNDIAYVKHISGRLISDSLIENIDFNMPVKKELARGKRITPYGKQFLDFINGESES